MLSFLYKSINRLLPFATPGTPLTTDLIHLVVLCGLLYYAPQIQTLIKDKFLSNSDTTQTQSQHEVPADHAATNDPPPDAPEPQAAALPPNHTAINANPPNIAQPDTLPDTAPAPPPADPAPADGAPGPAHAHAPGPDPSSIRNRQVGAKKAKSLARRDQRRAYNEFQRSQGEAQRAREAEGAAEREAALAEERARRAAVEAELREAEKREREERKERERREEAKERRAREVAVGIVRDAVRERGWVDLGEVAGRVGRGREWLEGLVRVEGMLGEREGEVTMVTGEGWLVRVTEGDMREVWKILEQRANIRDAETVGLDEVGLLLEKTLKAQGGVA
ncbi:hypothetical protein BDZ85DRAFT_313835 [Elsinoe ampelina]|uniref:Uncharacterized protein n=1 Tax=Elsinoe ampelina TaxID=302913 RepID=A0A6A6FY16_9PEZI|nr:hypothetical protein BDZ85DRAFT_313835 [Elsinoe ampelina]